VSKNQQPKPKVVQRPIKGNPGGIKCLKCGANTLPDPLKPDEQQCYKCGARMKGRRI
jgi:NAD-dependent SIR2 family protein deacetylase